MAASETANEWDTLHKALLASEDEFDIDGHDLVLALKSFYTGARGILKIQAFLLARGRYDELHAMIRRHGRQIDKLIKPRRQRPRHRNQPQGAFRAQRPCRERGRGGCAARRPSCASCDRLLLGL